MEDARAHPITGLMLQSNLMPRVMPTVGRVDQEPEFVGPLPKATVNGHWDAPAPQIHHQVTGSKRSPHPIQTSHT